MSNNEIKQEVLVRKAKVFDRLLCLARMDNPEIAGYRNLKDLLENIKREGKDLSKFIDDNEELEDE